MEKQIINRQPATVDEDGCVDDEVDIAFRCHSVEQSYKRDNEYQVVGEEAEELPEGIVPTWTEKRMEKVEGIAEEDTAKDDG